MLRIELIRDGHSNVSYLISGLVTNLRDAPLLDMSVLSPTPSRLRLDSVEFSVESGVKCFLSWPDSHCLPLEARGKFSLEWAGGLAGDQILLSTVGRGNIFLALDFTKIGV